MEHCLTAVYCVMRWVMAFGGSQSWCKVHYGGGAVPFLLTSSSSSIQPRKLWCRHDTGLLLLDLSPLSPSPLHHSHASQSIFLSPFLSHSLCCLFLVILCHPLSVNLFSFSEWAPLVGKQARGKPFGCQAVPVENSLGSISNEPMSQTDERACLPHPTGSQ